MYLQIYWQQYIYKFKLLVSKTEFVLQNSKSNYQHQKTVIYKNVFDSGFMHESIHKITKIQYYTKMTSLYQTKYLTKFGRYKAYDWILICF